MLFHLCLDLSLVDFAQARRCRVLGCRGGCRLDDACVCGSQAPSGTRARRCCDRRVQGSSENVDTHTAISCRLRDRLLGYVLDFGRRMHDRDLEQLGINCHGRSEEDCYGSEWGELGDVDEEDDESLSRDSESSQEALDDLDLD